MNKIFKIVFNAARGKMMVVNEATSSVQTGKKAAVTVAVIGALVSGSAVAADTYEYGIDSATQKESAGYRINVGEIASNEMFSFDDSTATLTLVGKQINIGDAHVDGGGALHAGVQVKSPNTQPLQPKIVMDGGEGTSLNIEVANGWGIVSRFAQVSIGSAENELDAITIKSNQDAAIYVTGGHKDKGYYYHDAQKLDLYAKEITITGEITGNEGNANIIASENLTVVGDISSNVTEYGNPSDLALVLRGGEGSSLNGNIEATNEATVDIALGQSSTITGGTILASSSADYTGGEIAIKLGEGSTVDSNVTAKNGGNIAIEFAGDAVENGNMISGDVNIEAGSSVTH